MKCTCRVEVSSTGNHHHLPVELLTILIYHMLQTIIKLIIYQNQLILVVLNVLYIAEKGYKRKGPGKQLWLKKWHNTSQSRNAKLVTIHYVLFQDVIALMSFVIM
jgi:hypothetical protein